MTERRKVNVYVDGYNLYYGSLKKTPYKWLDLAALAAQLLPGEMVRQVQYFTAPAEAPPDDPGLRERQETYFRALRTIQDRHKAPSLWIKEGFYLTKPKRMRKRFPEYGPNPDIPNPANKKVWVWKTEEKGSDVNLATSLLLDAAECVFHDAWVISNDSDLAWPIQMARKRYRVRVGVFKPERPAGYPYPDDSRPDSQALIKAARWFRRIEESHLAASQFPERMTDDEGDFSRPAEWAPARVLFPGR